MNPFLKPVKAAMRLLFINKFWSASLIVLLAGAGTFVAFSQTTPPNIKAITLSQDPLYTSVAADKPTLTLVLSNQESIAQPLYNTSDAYDVQKEYLGYFNAESCYTYIHTPTDVPSGETADNYKRFDLKGPAASKRCTGAMDGFSGNFLNYATSSSLDVIRMGLTGGDRWVDTGSSTESLTILQRAVISSGGDCPMSFKYLNPYARKSIPPSNGYSGAVPTSMQTQASGRHIVIANVTNKMVFARSSDPVNLVWPDTDTSLMPGQTHTGSDPVPTAKQVKTYARCGNQDYYFLSRTSGLTGSTTSGDIFFYPRVQVCNTNAAKVLQDVRDYGLCTQQPNGYYKPTGSLQKYSEQARVAVFGYLMDKNLDRYGGVLRAAMKYVGAKTFTSEGIDNTPDGGNPKKEWDTNTGVFYPNPDGATLATDGVTNSGVINYINKFGRNGANPNYRSWDPVGYLYNEALRYLQGHTDPDARAISGLTAGVVNSLRHDFPVAMTWSDPYGNRSTSDNYSCLKTNIFTISDIRTADGNYFERTANVDANLPDFKWWQEIVAQFEANGTLRTNIYPYQDIRPTEYTDGQGRTQTTSNFNTPNEMSLDTKMFGDAVNIVGQAYWARSHDIRPTTWLQKPNLHRPGLRVRSYFIDLNLAGDSTVGDGTSSTDIFRRTQNQLFRASKYGGYQSDDSNPDNPAYNKFGNPFKRQNGPSDNIGTNDNNVWQDPANPGEAGTFYLASDPRATIRSFDNAFKSAIGRTASRSFAKATVSNKTLSADGSLVYQASFDTGNWTGDVQATALTLTGTSTVSISTTPTFTVAAQLAARPASSPRNIVIGTIGTGTAPDPVASDFTWASLEPTMKTHLKKLTPTSPADSDATGEDRVKYLKGDRTKEGATFRTRTQLLGDIVNSGIVYSGSPTLNITPSTAAYKSFSANNSGRTAAIFVGANDGMLHAFNATTGDELFGYIPSWMGPKLAALTASTYTSNHQAYVDATPAVAEAQVGAAGDATDWKTVLVGGTGAGGPGVYALDVTNPAAFDASKVLWEFTKRDDADMGYVVGSPKIIKVRTSAAGTVPATYRWFAVVASGVNNYLNYTDSLGSYFSTTGKPALFFLALDKPAGTAWTSAGASPNYYKLSVPVNTTLNAANATGLINFQAILGPVGELAQIYMGDLHGKVWKLDFTTLATSAWTFDALSYYKYNAEAYPMYIAKTAGEEAVQPISMAPLVVSAATSGGRRTAYVSFGTGKFLEQSDTTSTAQNSFYTLYDDGTTSALGTGGSEIPGRGRLMLGAAATSGALSTVSVPSFKWGRPTADSTDVTGNPTRAGWYFDFPGTTEKSIFSASIIGDQLLFGSLNPATTVVAGSCRGGGGGSGTTYNVNIDAGNGTFAASDVGLLGEALTLEIPGSNGASGTGRRTKTVTQLRVNMGSNGARVDPEFSTTTSITGRLNWRQVNNYQDLKNAP